MKPWVRKVILVCLFAAIIIYMGLQIPYRNQSLTFNKNAALFDSVMQQVSGHLTENPEIKIYMDGDVYVAEGMEAEYDITEDEKLVSELDQLKELGIHQINAYYYEATSEYTTSSCEVWFAMDDGDRIIYTSNGHMHSSTDLIDGGDIKSKELKVRWRAGAEK
ncbi:MAG: hypothetical protein IKR21_06065 [Oscillospiraceae bacterium]|nr:hypothetical protein [Oscillospiraceae bacterium]